MSDTFTPDVFCFVDKQYSIERMDELVTFAARNQAKGDTYAVHMYLGSDLMIDPKSPQKQLFISVLEEIAKAVHRAQPLSQETDDE